MKLTFLGGADEVGASCTLVEVAGKKILVDAGIRISPKTSRGLQNDQLPHLAHLTDIGGPDAILVTHAHTDHTGALPQVVRRYPRVPIYATGATIELSRVLLQDSSRLMESRLEAEGELPLYDAADVDLLLQNWQPLHFGKALKLGADLQVTPYVSGHIAGAAMLVFESTEGVLVMSGDVSVSPQRTVESAKPPRITADAVVLESTYGGREHANRKYEEQRLIDTLKQVTDGGGRVLIPAFALGRAQEVIQILLAYSDEISVPVYVDGMVRAVCDAYGRFSDILPKPTVKSAGQRPLFFRDNVKPVRNRAMRDELMLSPDPCIIVASSGMLTGGASVAYASALASDPRNAIFLTGYQDEESPGRFLQTIMSRKERGETPYLVLNNERVPLRCQLAKYSLSAHADEAELIAIAEAMDAQRVFLVHGDSDARNSLWEQLQRKGRAVSRPRVGQEKAVAKRRSLVLKRDGEVGELESTAKLVDPEALWNLLIGHQGEEFTARELAQVWYGDVEQASEVVEALEDDPYYFAQDWKDKKRFTIRRRWQVDKAIKSHALMAANRDLAGQFIVMRNANGEPKLGVVTKVAEGSFEAIVQGSNATHHDGDAFVWSLGDWRGETDDPGTMKKQMHDVLTGAQGIMERVLPFTKRKLLALHEALVDPESLINPLELDNDEDYSRYQTELAAAVIALARDGATNEGDGLRVERALPDGPVNQQVAREAALRAFPLDARLRKVGMLAHKNTLILNFDFPEAARRLYADEIEALEMETGWEANIRMTTNQQALIQAVRDVLPAGASVVKGPSVYMDKKELAAEVAGLDADDVDDVLVAYNEMTHYTLNLSVRGGTTNGNTSISAIAVTPSESAGPMEINAAYNQVRTVLEPLGLQKAGLKNGEIVLTFVSPQVGARFAKQIAALSQETGYPMRLHDNPMQNIILDEARTLLRSANLTVQKGPGIHTDRGEVSIKLLEGTDATQIEQINTELEAKTGYRLVIR
jgi:Cft2 family RNA processing exonuclease